VENTVYAFIWYSFYFVDSLTITDLYLQKTNVITNKGCKIARNTFVNSEYLN